jgi:hypothetical protein
MPYVSQKQERFFHTQTAKDKGIKPSTVKEFDKASKGKKLPKYSKTRKVLEKK